MGNMKMKTNYVWIVLWIIFFGLGTQIGCNGALCNKGIRIINGEYYRFFTGLLLHVNLLHLLANVITIVYVLDFLEWQVRPIRLFAFSAIVAVITNIIFSIIYPGSKSIGGSPVIFGLLGLICIMQIIGKDVPRFSLETAHARWMIGYAILGNIPIFSKNVSTLIIHSIAFCVAILFGYLGLPFIMKKSEKRIE